MGKTRRNRVRPNRKDPLSTTPKPPSDPELAALREKSVLPVIKDLQSADPKRRTLAAAAVANLVADTRCRKLFLREQIVHIILSETLTDASLESRAAGWDILRLLAEEEEGDFCVHLFRSDVLSAVEFAAKFVVETIKSKGAKTGKAEQKVLWSLIESLLALLTALSEAQDDILEAIVALPATVTLLFLALASADAPAPAPVRLDALSCLLILTEDNRRLAELVVADEDPKPFSALLGLQGTDPLSKTLKPPSDPELAALREKSVLPVIKDLQSADPKRRTAAAAAVANLVADTRCRKLFLREQIVHIILNETLTDASLESRAAGWDILRLLAEEEEADFCVHLFRSDVLSAVEFAAKFVVETIKSKGAKTGKAEQKVLWSIIESLLALLTALSEAQDDILEAIVALPATVTLLFLALASADAPAHVRLDALSCLLILTEDNRRLAELIVADEDPKPFSALLGLQGTHGAGQVLACGVLHNDNRRLAELIVADEDPKPFSALLGLQGTHGAGQVLACGVLHNDPFQGLGVKCIGVLGQLALDPTPVALNREIGVFLITVVASLPDTPAADVVEALNQLFDIYGDEDAMCDVEVFWKDNFLAQLEGVQHKVKTMVKAINKRTNSELRTRADEVVLNLARFISYKKKNKPKA
ncbi:hypothetical protein BN1723_004807 [Verticillium longisporum]|uniref:SYO1-like TPR repeats domain-containing protein n=1 Tax=Verticillium longisporum TaxID=100787 RepID=A0A0G4N206_VERLO|nr:hypothetical protein BN1723_004807 [Verticillium longisporum]